MRPRAVIEQFDEEIELIEQLVFPASHHHGPAALPPEIFLCILGILGHLYRPDRQMRTQTIRTLSRVSRRFRECVISTPVFWTYWGVSSLASSAAAIQTYSWRSGSTGLVLDTGSKEVPEFTISVDEVASFCASHWLEISPAGSWR